MRYIILSDAELTRERLPIAARIFEELLPEMRGADRFIFAGDLFRELNALTIFFATSWMREFASMTKERPLLIVGNHDREVGADRLSAIFRETCDVENSPIVLPGTPTIAVLPAPDRAAFGASRGAEGKRERDDALSNALEAALIAFETQIGPENLGRAILFFHGAVSGEEITMGQIASGLTWSIPGARLQRWGLCIGGHIHKPGHNGNVWSVGGIANWTFSDRAEQYRALVVDTDTLEVTEIPLLRALMPIELTVERIGNATGIRMADNPATGLCDCLAVVPDLTAPGHKIASHLTGFCGVKAGDTLNLKLHFKLPPEQLALLPTNEALEAQIADGFAANIQTLTVCREPVGLSKVRLETEDARSLSLKELFAEYMRVNGKAPAPEVQAEIESGLAWLETLYKPVSGAVGFKPIRLEVNDFRQWQHAVIDFPSIQGGATVITGANESGKSNLLESIQFVLDKRTPSSPETLAGEIRRGATSCSVIFTFEAPDGEVYKVSRALTNGRGKADCKTEFLRATSDEGKPWEPVCGENEASTEIEKRICEMVGSPELRRWLMFRSGGDLDTIIKAKPSEWGAIVQKTFNVSVFDPLRVAAQNKAEIFIDNNKSLEAKVEELETQIAADGKALEEMAGPEALQNRIEAAQKILAVAEERLAGLNSERGELAAKRGHLADVAEQKRTLEYKLAGIDRELAKPVEEIGERPLVPAVEIEVLEAEAKELKAQREKLLDADEAKCSEWGKVSGQIAALEEQIANCQAEIEALEANLKAHEASKGKLERTKCEEKEIETEYLRGLPSDSPPVREGCAAWLYYSKADQGAELQKKLDAARERKMLRGGELRLANEKGKDALAACVATKAAINKIAPKIRELEGQIGEHRNLVAEARLWDEKEKGQRAEAIRHQSMLEDGNNIRMDLIRITVELSGLDALRNRLLEVDRTTTEFQREIVKARGIVDEAGAAILGRKNLEAAIEAKRQRQSEHRGTVAGNNVKREAWETLEAAFHSTGIPYLLMERNIGHVEMIANELLEASGSDLRVRVQTITPTQKGEARDKISVYFMDSRGENQLRQASGEQSLILSMALSPALSIAGAEFCGSKPYLYMQDEGWDRLDLEHRETLRSLISEIAARFGWFLYIAHLDWIVASADYELKVVSNNGHSELVQ
jgi:DNA repair exonuclease SbcCD ATPase subunit